MWKAVFAKQAAKDAKRLKSAGLDEKAKALVEAVGEDLFKRQPSYGDLSAACRGCARAG